MAVGVQGLVPQSVARLFIVAGLSLGATACIDTSELEQSCASDNLPADPNYEIRLPEGCAEAMTDFFGEPTIPDSLEGDALAVAEATQDRFYEAMYLNISFPALALPGRRVFSTDLVLPESWDAFIPEVDVASGQALPKEMNLELAVDFAQHFDELEVVSCDSNDSAHQCSSNKTAALEQLGGSRARLLLHDGFAEQSAWASAATLTHENLHHRDYAHEAHQSCPWFAGAQCDSRLDQSYASVLYTIAQLQAAYFAEPGSARVSLWTIGDQARRSCRRLANHVFDFQAYLDERDTNCSELIETWAQELSFIRAQRSSNSQAADPPTYGELRQTCASGWSPSCAAAMETSFPLEDFFGVSRQNTDPQLYEGLREMLFAPVSAPADTDVENDALKALALDGLPEARLHGFRQRVTRIVDEPAPIAASLTKHQPLLLAKSLLASDEDTALLSTSEAPKYRSLDRALQAYITRHTPSQMNANALILRAHVWYIAGARQLDFGPEAQTEHEDLDAWQSYACAKYAGDVPEQDCAAWVDAQLRLAQ